MNHRRRNATIEMKSLPFLERVDKDLQDALLWHLKLFVALYDAHANVNTSFLVWSSARYWYASLADSLSLSISWERGRGTESCIALIAASSIVFCAEGRFPFHLAQSLIDTIIVTLLPLLQQTLPWSTLSLAMKFERHWWGRIGTKLTWFHLTYHCRQYQWEYSG